MPLVSGFAIPSSKSDIIPVPFASLRSLILLLSSLCFAFLTRFYEARRMLDSVSHKNFTKTALAQCTVLAMAASPESVPPLYQVNGKTVPPENHGNVRQRLGIRIKQRTPNTAAMPQLHRCHSTNTNQQAETI